MSQAKMLAMFGLFIGAVCAAPPATAQPTIVVSGANAPAVNGANLLAALAAVRAPQGLVKLEPGTYEVPGSISMRNGVDLEGSGRGTTTIRAVNGSVPVVFNAGVVAELREVRVENSAANSAGLPAILIASSGARLSRVDASLDLAFLGIVIDQASPRLNDVDILVQPRVGDSAVGLYAVGGAPVIENLRVVFRSGSGNIHRGVVLADSAATIDALTIVGATDLRGLSVGVAIENPAPDLVVPPVVVKIRDADIRVHTAQLGQQAYAISVAFNHLELHDSRASASTNLAAFTAGLVGLDGAVVAVHGSVLRGLGDGGRGVWSGVPGDPTSPTLGIHHSRVEGETQVYQRNAGTISFGASQLIGARPAPLSAACAHAYDAAYALLNGPC